MGFRKEIDLIGELDIPNDAYYGIHTVRAMQNFTISNQTIADTPDFIRGMVYVKKASALANKKCGSLTPEIADAIVKACDVLLKDNSYLSQFPIDAFQGGAGTSLNMNVNEVIANIALEDLGHQKGEYNYIHPNDHVNESQSTNDAFPTGLKLAIYKNSEDLLEAAEALEEGLKEKAQEFKEVLKMGRTQLQDAVPMSLGQEFNAFSSLITGAIRDIKWLRGALLTVNLSGTAIGTGVNTPPNYGKIVIQELSTVTGYPCQLADDLIASTSDLTDFVKFHASLKNLALKLAKICNDLRLLSSGPRAGLKEINLPELQAGSSIMPAKVNPVLPEAVNNACFKVFGNDTAVTMAADASQLQLSAMEPVVAQAIFESLLLMTNACRSLQEKCIKGITANEERCLKNILHSVGIITYFNPIIGHAEGDIVGRICIETGKSVKEVILERNLMSEETFDSIFNLEAIRQSIGLDAFEPNPDLFLDVENE